MTWSVDVGRATAAGAPRCVMKSVPAKTRVALSVRTASDPIRRRRSDPSASVCTVRSYRVVHVPVGVMGRNRALTINAIETRPVRRVRGQP